MSNFYPWAPDGETLSSTAFRDDSERTDGFKANTVASSIKVNTALAQANLLSVAMYNALQQIYLKNDIDNNIKVNLDSATLENYKQYVDRLAILCAKALTTAFAKANNVYYHQVSYSKIFTGSSLAAGSLHTLQCTIHILDKSANRAEAITTSNIESRIMDHLTDDMAPYWITDVVYKLSKGISSGQTIYPISSAKFVNTTDIGITFKGLQLRVNKDGTDELTTIDTWATTSSNYNLVVTDEFFSINDVLS